jgi:hypothetical protein
VATDLRPGSSAKAKGQSIRLQVVPLVLCAPTIGPLVTSVSGCADLISTSYR